MHFCSNKLAGAACRKTFQAYIAQDSHFLTAFAKAYTAALPKAATASPVRHCAACRLPAASHCLDPISRAAQRKPWQAQSTLPAHADPVSAAHGKAIGRPGGNAKEFVWHLVQAVFAAVRELLDGVHEELSLHVFYAQVSCSPDWF